MSSIYEVLAERKASHPDKNALFYSGKQALSYAGLAEQTRYVVEILNSVGVTRNDTVAVIMPNGAAMASVCLGTMACASCAPLNPEYRHEELKAMIHDLETRALIVDSSINTSASSIAEQLDIPIIELDSSQSDVAGRFTLSTISTQNPVPEPLFAGGDDIALLLHTSGTTYKPKIVPLSHTNILATAKNLGAALKLDDNDICMNIMPMFHIGGLVDLLIAPLYWGGGVVLSPAFSAELIPGLVSAFRPSWTQVVPTMLEDICQQLGDRPETLKGEGPLEYVRCVAAKLPVELAQRFEALFDMPVLEVYGMTETTTLIASNPLPPGIRKPGSVGCAAGPEIAIMDEHGKTLSAGSSGEVVVRGPSIMKGYRGISDNTSSFYGDWFRTGDYGYFDDDAYLFLTGRIKEMINRGGEKIDPSEIDDVLRAFPGIADAACFGIAHEALGEDVASALVLEHDAELDQQALMVHLGQKLAYFKVPRTLFLTDHIDKTQNGKIKRAQLAARLEGEQSIQLDVSAAAETSLSELGEILSAMWCAVLEIESISVMDNFFDLGGDSLKALTFLVELNNIGGESVFVTALYDAPTLSQFESLLREQHPDVCQRLLDNAASTELSSGPSSGPSSESSSEQAPVPGSDPSLQSSSSEPDQVPVRAQRAGEITTDLNNQPGTDSISAELRQRLEQTGLTEEIYWTYFNSVNSRHYKRVRPDSLLYKFNEQGNKPPLFLCIAFHKIDIISKQLGDQQPIYGLGAGQKMMENTLMNKKSVARYLTQEILDIQPQGPYMLGGYCRGAWIMHQVAHELQEMGHEISVLFSIENIILEPWVRHIRKLVILLAREGSVNPYPYFVYPGPEISWYLQTSVDMEFVEGVHLIHKSPGTLRELGKLMRQHLSQADTSLSAVEHRQALSINALPDDYYQSKITSDGIISLGRLSWKLLKLPRKLALKINRLFNRKIHTRVHISNNSSHDWVRSQIGPVYLCCRWHHPNANSVLSLIICSTLPETVKAGETIEMAVSLDSPVHSAKYRLEFDLMDENKNWFRNFGGEHAISFVHPE